MSEVNVPRGMKKRTINDIISKKIDKWIKTVDNEQLRIRIRPAVIVTGGAITSMLLGEIPNDFDVYFSDITLATDLAQYYAAKMTNLETFVITPRGDNSGVCLEVKHKNFITADSTFNFNVMTSVDTEKYEPLFISANAITLSDKIQLIFRFVGDPDVIHENYDFVHTKNYWTNANGVVFNGAALAATLAKELVYTGSKYPLCSMFRIKKFIERGWTITAGDMLKIAWDINELDLKNVDVLKEQLIGVDYMYFLDLIRKMEQNKEENNIWDRAYIMDLIDLVFRGEND
jgi:hypothetical protein